MSVVAWIRRPALLKAGKVAGYVGFGLAAFLVGVVLTFPTNRLRSYLEARLSQGPVTVRIDQVSMRGLGSLRLTGVHVELPPEAPGPATGGAADVPATPAKRTVTLDQVDVSVGLFRLLFGTVSVTARVTDEDGILGPVQIVSTKDSVAVDITQIKDFPIPTELALFGVRLSGRLNGKGTLTYDLKEGLAASAGHIEVTATQVRALKPTLKSEGGAVTLTDVDLGKVTLDVYLDKRSNLAAFKAERRAPGADGQVIQFEKAEIDGSDAKVVTDGHSTIRLFSGKGLGDGQLAVDLAFALNDPFFERTVNVGGESQTPNRFLRTLLSMNPTWKNALSGSYYGVTCGGTLSHPSCTPKKPSIRGGDFKLPAKEEDKGTGSAGAARPAAAPAAPSAPAPKPPEPTRPAPINPTAASPTPAGPPPRAGAEDGGGALTPGTPQKVEVTTVPTTVSRPGLVPMQPTVIGRPRARMRTDDEPEQGASPTEGGAPATAVPAPQE